MFRPRRHSVPRRRVCSTRAVTANRDAANLAAFCSARAVTANRDGAFLQFIFQEAILFDFPKPDVEVHAQEWEESWENAFKDYNGTQKVDGKYFKYNRTQQVDDRLELYLGLLGSTLDLDRNIAHTKRLFQRIFKARNPQAMIDRAPELKTVLGQWAFGHLLADYIWQWSFGHLLAAGSRRRCSTVDIPYNVSLILDNHIQHGSRRRSSSA